MVNWKSRGLGDVLSFLNVVVFVVLINLLVASNFYRVDLTEEKRYTIKTQTRGILKELEDDGLVTRKVYTEVPPRVEYTITQTGAGLIPAIDSMRVWAEGMLEAAN